MFSRNHIINLASLILIAFINSIYMLVFSPKVFLNPFFSSIAFFVLFIFIVRSVDTYKLEKYKLVNINTITALSISLAIILILFLFVFDNLLPINKFMAAKIKLQNQHYLLSSFQVAKYIYNSYREFETVNRFLGITGLLLISFFYIKNTISTKAVVIKILLLIFTPILYLGIIIQGELVLLTGLVILLIYFLEKQEKQSILSYTVLLAASGMFLCFYLASVLLVIIFSFYFFRNNLIKAFGFFFLSIICFGIINYLFRIPLIHNGELQGILWLIIIFCILAIYLGWSVSNIYEVFFSSGVLIFLLLICLLCVDLISNGTHEILSKVYGLNLAAFYMPIALLIASIHGYKIDKFLGKVISDF